MQIKWLSQMVRGKKSWVLTFVLKFLWIVPGYGQSQDWANLKRYRLENDSLMQIAVPKDRVVLMGNSITDLVIECGTNDIAGNTGYLTLRMIEDNIESMTDLSRANKIRVILGAVLPATRFAWRPDLQPAERIDSLNQWVRRSGLSGGRSPRVHSSAWGGLRE